MKLLSAGFKEMPCAVQGRAAGERTSLALLRFGAKGEKELNVVGFK
jgi:hypothetical protein